MPCYKPLKGYRARQPNESGKYGIVFNVRKGDSSQMVELPCGQCIGCRLERSRQWALRCLNEASLYEDNCFLTLTYRPSETPEHGNLNLEDFQKFMKRLRKSQPGHTIRYFMCGEYGENLTYSKNGKFGHPHFHACIFNFDFPDKKLFKHRDGIKLYTSPLLEKLWPFGHSTIGNVTFESAAYTARYLMKKQLGRDAENYYKVNIDGKEIEIKPEFVTMSRRPGIGYEWYKKFKKDLHKDFITSRGVKMKPPKYYDSLMEKEDPERYEEIKEKRKQKAEEKYIPGKDGGVEMHRRQDEAEKIKKKRIKLLPRNLDNES